MKIRMKNNGAVFLIVVFAIALMTTITVGILVMTTEELQLMQNQLYAANAMCTAEAGVNDALAQIRSSSSWTTGFTNKAFNSGSYTNFNAQTKGTELAIEGSWADGIRTRASYSFQYTKNNTVGWQMPDSPTHMVKLNLSLPLVKDKLFADA